MIITCDCLFPELASQQSAHVHICSSLLCSVHSRVLLLMVSINSWLETRLFCPRVSLLLPAPRPHFSAKRLSVNDSSSSWAFRLSLHCASTTGGSRVSLPPSAVLNMALEEEGRQSASLGVDFFQRLFREQCGGIRGYSCDLLA